jgi:hypothetical protein
MIMQNLSNSFLPAGVNADTLNKLLDGLDLSSIKGTISSVVRSVGFGPEADMIATVLVGAFVVLVVIGYTTGPGTKGANGSGSVGGAADPEVPGKPHKGDKSDTKA